MQILGIVNVTEDSFSDGGQFLDKDAAIAHGERLLEDGADWLDIGAESSHPKSARVSAEVEIARLSPVVSHFVARGAQVAIDTYKAEVMAAMCALGAQMINDIQALASDEARAAVAPFSAKVVLMFSRAGSDTDAPLAPALFDFFDRRIAECGIARERLILDPGMGYFLGPKPEPSLEALRLIPELRRRFALPVYVSTTRKSFIGKLTGRTAPLERAAGTLATELFALMQGVDYVRTHDARALRDAAIVWRALTPQ